MKITSINHLNIAQSFAIKWAIPSVKSTVANIHSSKKDVLFIIGDWNAKVGSQETPGVTGKFGLRIRNEAGQRLIEYC